MRYKRQVVSDVEGPVTKNDIAQEIYSISVDRGSKTYPVISDMDDLWSELFHPEVKDEVGVDPGYRNGGTLKWILPQLKAVGMTNELMENISANTISLINGADTALRYLQDKGPLSLISTSYSQYLSAASRTLGVPMENIYSTDLDLDSVELTGDARRSINEIGKELATMERFDVLGTENQHIEDYPADVARRIERLNQIFWKEMMAIPGARELIQNTNPIGGTGKVEAMYNALGKTGNDISGVMAVGDSITDRRMLKEVKDGRGLPVSFNGSREAVKHADIGIMAHHIGPWIMIGDMFLEHGKDAAMEFAYKWSQRDPDDFQGLFRSSFSGSPRIDYKLVQDTLIASAANEFPVVRLLDDSNRDDFAEESSAYRKRVRGVSGSIR